MADLSLKANANIISYMPNMHFYPSCEILIYTYFFFMDFSCPLTSFYPVVWEQNKELGQTKNGLFKMDFKIDFFFF